MVREKCVDTFKLIWGGVEDTTSQKAYGWNELHLRSRLDNGEAWDILNLIRGEVDDTRGQEACG